VTITATATGYPPATGTTSVLDNDVHHFTVSAIASPQVKGVPFNVTITAKDVNDVTIPSYIGTPALTAAGSAGAVSISPAYASPFSNGSATVSVTANTFDNNVVLTVTDSPGHTG